MYWTFYKGTTLHIPTWQFWDSGGVKLESLCNFNIVVCQWTVNCLLGTLNGRTCGHSEDDVTSMCKGYSSNTKYSSDYTSGYWRFGLVGGRSLLVCPSANSG